MADTKSRAWTCTGLLVAFLGIPLITTLYRCMQPAGEIWLVVRELLILGLTGSLLWIVVKKERQPLSSIGLKFDRLGMSVLVGLGYTVLLFALLLGILTIYQQLGISYGEGTSISKSLPVAALIVVRAGISEEVLYRGYALERVALLTGSKWIASIVAVAAFALFHFSQGMPGIFIAGAMGTALTVLYWWKRSLLPLIIAHFMVDFVPNVLGPLLG